MVHIADVSHYVRPGTALDREAIRRATSVYLVDQVVPMLPEQLSNGLCSLNPKVDRLAFTAILTLDEHANVRSASFARTVINSNARLTYEEAMEIISGTQKSYARFGLSAPRTSRIRQAHKLAQKLRRHRMRDEGALNMELPEVRFSLGEDGRIADVNPVTHDESHQLIEEFMLLANEYVARELSTRGAPHVHRIHDAPDPERLIELADRFVAAGIPVGNLANRHNLVKLLNTIADMPQRHAWNTAVLRSMRKAEYSVKSVGHYGLNKQFYDHFTSPIRRYPDLLNHRILGSLIARQAAPYSNRDLTELSRHCSACERNAMEAERELIALKRLRFFADQLENGDPITYRAIVTEVRHFGIMIEVIKVQAIGLIPLNLLSDDFYRFDPARLELRGADTGRTFRVGDELPVQIARVDFDRQFLDFLPVDMDDQPAPGRQRRSGKQEKSGKSKGKRSGRGKRGRRR
jgi:ribonuclease R